jgi:integral membrane protein
MLNNAPHFHSQVGRVRIAGIIEGISFLLLLGLAMPMKYFAGQPQYVRVIGMIHGILFLTFCLSVLHALLNGKITFCRAVLALFASLLPCGTFLIDKKLTHDEQRELEKK